MPQISGCTQTLNPSVRASNLLPDVRSLLKDWLLPRLSERCFSQAKIADHLMVQPPHIAAWLSGTAAMPRRHEIALSDLLHLSRHEFVDLILIGATMASANEIDRLFLAQVGTRLLRTGHATFGTHIKSVASVCNQLKEYAMQMAKSDAETLPHISPYKHIHTHFQAAERVAKDLLHFFRGEEALFARRNIYAHLRYPLNYYLSFFLHTVPRLDSFFSINGSRLLNESLDIGKLELSSNLKVDVTIARHCLHMQSRFRRLADADLVFRKLIASDDIESARMQMFGRVYGAADGGPFEELCWRLSTDERFSAAAFRFDAYHYGDGPSYQSSANTDIVPLNAFFRHLAGMIVPTHYIREVSAARAAALIESHGRIIGQAVNQNVALAKRIAEVIDIGSKHSWEQKTLSKVRIIIM